MNASTVATLIIRNNAIALLIVAAKGVFDIVYIYCNPTYRASLTASGTPYYAFAQIALELAAVFFLFRYSRHLGNLLARDLSEPADRPSPASAPPHEGSGS